MNREPLGRLTRPTGQGCEWQLTSRNSNPLERAGERERGGRCPSSKQAQVLKLLWAQLPILSPNCVIPGQSLNFSVPLFRHL